MPIIDSEKTEELVGLFQQSSKRIVPFVGAGLSLPLFPSWSALLRTMVNRCVNRGSFAYGEEMKKKIEEGKDYLDIASICSQFLGAQEYWEILEDMFGKTFQPDDIPLPYRELIALDLDLILTTNYDRIPEIAGKGVYSTYTNRNASEASRAFERGSKLVFKLHGDITDRQSIILTRSDYATIQYGVSSVKAFLQAILSTKTILFLGFGMTDPHLRMLLEFLTTVHSGIPITHYVLLSGLTELESISLEQALGVKIIRYDPDNASHPEVLELIQRLKGEKSGITDGSRLVATEADLGARIAAALNARLGSRHFVASYEEGNRTLFVTYGSRSSSERELQNEFVQLIKAMDFECPLVDRVVVSIQRPTQAARSFDDFFFQEVGASFTFPEAVRFATGKITEEEFWSGISFFRSIDTGTSIRQNIRVDLPHIGV